MLHEIKQCLQSVVKSVDHRASEQIVEGFSIAKDGRVELLGSGIAQYLAVAKTTESLYSTQHQRGSPTDDSMLVSVCLSAEFSFTGSS
jgi:hypothetical protein